MMDANGDYQLNDHHFKAFLTKAGLGDPFFDRFQISPPTYVRGSCRLDYIFVDPSLTSSLLRIGYLGTHDGAVSDHVMAVADFDEHTLFAGTLNRPPAFHSREILIEQADKTQAFLQTVLPRLKDQHIQQRTFELAESFTTGGACPGNITTYHLIYSQLLEIVRGAASEVGRKKFGYMRSPELTTAGRLLNAHIMLLDCRTRNSPPTPALLRLCSILGIDAHSTLQTSSVLDLRRAVRKYRTSLWETQKHCEGLRYEWLERVAQDRAGALHDPDWEKKLNQMKRTARDNATNRKLSYLTKGRKGSLDRIQVPMASWYISPTRSELYHYDQGVFEAYPEAYPGAYHSHHTIKVPAPDAVRAEVCFNPTHNTWNTTSITEEPLQWEDISRQDMIEGALLQRNERHLRQTELEGGISTKPPLTDIRSNYGINEHTTQILNTGRCRTLDLTPEMAAFLHLFNATQMQHPH
jgi:hypothetical protein